MTGHNGLVYFRRGENSSKKPVSWKLWILFIINLGTCFALNKTHRWGLRESNLRRNKKQNKNQTDQSSSPTKTNINIMYGDVGNIDTTGASSETANADGHNAGPGGSHSMAKDDLPYVNNYKDKIMSVSRQTGVQAAVIAGIISRESRGGRGLDSNGCGDHGNAFGLMQIDKRWHNPKGGPYSEEHILQATQILIGCYGEIKAKFPRWNKSQWLKGALAAYNMGASRVQSYESVDANTTGRDYSNDVTARAQFFQGRGY